MNRRPVQTSALSRERQQACRHAQGTNTRELARVFRCAVTFGASETEMRLAASVLRLPHVRADSRWLDVLTRYADLLLRDLPRRGDLAAVVSSSIARQLATSMPSLASTVATWRPSTSDTRG
jgi:hypothetical protein